MERRNLADEEEREADTQQQQLCRHRHRHRTMAGKKKGILTTRLG